MLIKLKVAIRKRLSRIAKRLEESLTPVINAKIQQVILYKESDDENRPFRLGELIWTKDGPCIVAVAKGWAPDPYVKERESGKRCICARGLKGSHIKSYPLKEVAKLIIRDEEGNKYPLSPSIYGHASLPVLLNSTEEFIITARGKAIFTRKRKEDLSLYDQLCHTPNGFSSVLDIAKSARY